MNDLVNHGGPLPDGWVFDARRRQQADEKAAIAKLMNPLQHKPKLRVINRSGQKLTTSDCPWNNTKTGDGFVVTCENEHDYTQARRLLSVKMNYERKHGHGTWSMRSAPDRASIVVMRVKD